GDGKCMRMNRNGSESSFPIGSYGSGLQTKDMACGYDGTEGVERVCPASAGSTLTFEFRSWPDDPSHPSLDPSHMGPCAVYMKSVKSAINDSAAGDGWFKIWDEGYDEKEEKWCTNKMIDNGGRMSVKVPTELAGGYYLVRPEFVALHAADKGDPQFYTGCAQIFLKSSGNAKPSKTVSIPGFVDKDTPGLTFNIWETPMALPYPIPGPEVAELVGTDSVSANTVQTQTEGETPSGDACILENANWCGKEVPSYSDEAGCWASQSNCWDQGDVCYHPYGGDLGPTTGSAGCDKWQDYCQSLEDLCNAGNFN
ncbi:hypothetical protein LTS18_000850, partial [Coniosporium uncinatum]